jgi:hypothetical protein
LEISRRAYNNNKMTTTERQRSREIAQDWSLGSRRISTTTTKEP